MSEHNIFWLLNKMQISGRGLRSLAKPTARNYLHLEVVNQLVYDYKRFASIASWSDLASNIFKTQN